MRVRQLLALFIVPFAFVGAQTSSEENDDLSSHEFMPFFAPAQMPTGPELALFKDKIMKICLDITLPDTTWAVEGVCLFEVLNKTNVLNDFLDGKFPDKQMIGTHINELTMCKIKKYGVSYNNSYVDLREFSDAVGFVTWANDDKTKVILNEHLTKCLDKRSGSTALQMIQDFGVCMFLSIIDHCEMKEGDLDDIGMFVVMMANLYTINSPQCSNVDMPNDAKTILMNCIDEAKTNFKNNPIENTMSEREKWNMTLRIEHLKKRFMKDIFMASKICAVEKHGFVDPLGMINVDKTAEYVRNFTGWENTSQREEVVSAIKSCRRTFSSDDSGENQTSAEDMLEMWKDKKKFYKCFFAKFPKTCGIKGEIVDFFYPLFNQDYMNKMVKTFMEIGGETAINFTSTIKERLRMFQGAMG